MILSKRIVWDAATCGCTLNYQHDEPTSFFFVIPVEAAHQRLPSFDLLYLEEESLPEILQQRVRKERLKRNKEARRKAVEKMLTARKSAAGTAPGISAQLAEREVQPRDRGGICESPPSSSSRNKSIDHLLSYFSEFHFFYFSIRLHFSGAAG